MKPELNTLLLLEEKEARIKELEEANANMRDDAIKALCNIYPPANLDGKVKGEYVKCGIRMCISALQELFRKDDHS